jgi:hypothetical protein
MITEQTSSYPVSVFVGGDPYLAESICRRYCDNVGFCVTVTPTEYVYTEGQTEGVIVGLINYPRFPATQDDIWARAEELAHLLREELDQESFTIQAPDKTVWFSWRHADPAIAAAARQGGDGTAPAESPQSGGEAASPKSQAPSEHERRGS